MAAVPTKQFNCSSNILVSVQVWFEKLVSLCLRLHMCCPPAAAATTAADDYAATANAAATATDTTASIATASTNAATAATATAASISSTWRPHGQFETVGEHPATRLSFQRRHGFGTLPSEGWTPSLPALPAHVVVQTANCSVAFLAQLAILTRAKVLAHITCRK
eukprot:294257-Amphidinium_carterae.1